MSISIWSREGDNSIGRLHGGAHPFLALLSATHCARVSRTFSTVCDMEFGMGPVVKSTSLYCVCHAHGGRSACSALGENSGGGGCYKGRAGAAISFRALGGTSASRETAAAVAIDAAGCNLYQGLGVLCLVVVTNNPHPRTEHGAGIGRHSTTNAFALCPRGTEIASSSRQVAADSSH